MRPLPQLAGIILGGICLAVTGLAVAEDRSAPAQAAPRTASATKHRSTPDTLMFTPDEFNDIQTRATGGGATGSESGGGGRQAIEDATLYLSTILYAGPSDWTIWINGAPISANQGFQAFQVTEITPNSVDLLVPLSAQGMKPVHLQPNQTFVTKTGVVVEGKYP